MRKKQSRKDEFETLPRCIKFNPHQAGRWNEVFGNNNPIVLELACGKALFACELAHLNPTKNIVAVDVKRDRLWYGAQRAAALQLPNIRFLWEDLFVVGELFDKHEIEGIWITFPDPYPKERHARRRLTAPYFLDHYRTILKPGASLQFKTDNRDLFLYSLETISKNGFSIIKQTTDLHGSPYLTAETGIQTDYERKFRAEGKTIYYLEAQVG